MFVQVVFPLPFRKEFTYSVPAELKTFIKPGVRVAAPFGKRTLTGFIVSTSSKSSLKPEEIKNIKDVLDERPVFDSKTFEFYKWLSDYYLSSLGEALKLIVPSGIEVESKRKIIADSQFASELLQKEKNKKTVRSKILKVLSEHDEITFKRLQKAVRRKNIYSVVQSLKQKGVIAIADEIEQPKVKPKKLKFVKLEKTIAEVYSYLPEIEKRSPKQVKILLNLLKLKNKPVPLADLIKHSEASHSSINSLEKKGFISVFDKEVERVYEEIFTEEKSEIRITLAQKEVIDEISPFIDEAKFGSFLLHGVTGSGKTQVYIELVKKNIDKKSSALILVPEISLTPQITSRLFNNFGNEVSVIHSRMSAGERYDSWRRILKGKCRIVIGARSALFSPIKNLGLIVVDEEHDSSYKQSDQVPKYHARDAAIVLAKTMSCPVLLGSATPSMESMYNAKTGKYKLLQLPDRIDDAKLPKISLINLSKDRKQKKSENIFTKTLLDKIEDRLKKKEGIIILQNRRGFSTQVFCEDCGEVEMCDNCSVPLVFHINQNTMQCHYCGLMKTVPPACTNCGSIKIKFFGLGTERIEDELEFFFPVAKVSRIDSDSISRKSSLSKILFSFGKGEIDILVGTQMVSKGLDFPRVTLVGVVAAETTLWLPDFRADERTFQLLTQVSGRAGRSKNPGQVIIQTQNEKHFALQKVLQNDYKGFYQKEISDRKKMDYPPFCRLALIETKDSSNDKALGAIHDFHKHLKSYKKWLKISEPTSALIAKLKGEYRYHILIKSFKEKDPGGAILRKGILESFTEFNKRSRYKEVKTIFDIDPQSIM